MTTATTDPYTIRLQSEDDTPGTITGSADEIHSALDAAWQLNRHFERTTEVVDNRDGEPRVVARVSVEWLDG